MKKCCPQPCQGKLPGVPARGQEYFEISVPSLTDGLGMWPERGDKNLSGGRLNFHDIQLLASRAAWMSRLIVSPEPGCWACHGLSRLTQPPSPAVPLGAALLWLSQGSWAGNMEGQTLPRAHPGLWTSSQTSEPTLPSQPCALALVSPPRAVTILGQGLAYTVPLTDNETEFQNIGLASESLERQCKELIIEASLLLGLLFRGLSKPACS